MSHLEDDTEGHQRWWRRQAPAGVGGASDGTPHSGSGSLPPRQHRNRRNCCWPLSTLSDNRKLFNWHSLSCILLTTVSCLGLKELRKSQDLMFTRKTTLYQRSIEAKFVTPLKHFLSWSPLGLVSVSCSRSWRLIHPQSSRITYWSVPVEQRLLEHHFQKVSEAFQTFLLWI